MTDLTVIPAEVREAYTDLRVLPDGRIIGVHRLMFHWSMHIDIDPVGYADRYCFGTYALAFAAYCDWNGAGDPEGWHRHPKSARRRDVAADGTVLSEWVSA